MNIAYAVTENYAHKIAPSVRSLIEHNPKAKVYVVTETDTLDFDLPVKPTVINVKNQKWFPQTGPNYANRFTYINYLKNVYASLLKVNKVIHLDADTIICDSLDPLWKTDVSGKWFAACIEMLGSYHPFGPVYYNMGVALINLAQIRKDGAEEKMVNYINTVPKPYPDQDAWNKFALEEDKAVPLDGRFNECFCVGKTNDPAIVHYCGVWDWWTNRAMERRAYLDKYMR